MPGHSAAKHFLGGDRRLHPDKSLHPIPPSMPPSIAQGLCSFSSAGDIAAYTIFVLSLIFEFPISLLGLSI